jgi:hypothetical protein
MGWATFWAVSSQTHLVTLLAKHKQHITAMFSAKYLRKMEHEQRRKTEMVA